MKQGLMRAIQPMLCAAALLAVWTAVGNARAATQELPAAAANPETSAAGRQVYEQLCQACHMADAKGGGSAGALVPALADNPRLADKDYGIQMLLKGRAGMPWFTDMLSQQQMAAVLTYVRGHFNAYTEPVTVADIERRAAANPAKRPDAQAAN